MKEIKGIELKETISIVGKEINGGIKSTIVTETETTMEIHKIRTFRTSEEILLRGTLTTKRGKIGSLIRSIIGKMTKRSMRKKIFLTKFLKNQSLDPDQILVDHLRLISKSKHLLTLQMSQSVFAYHRKMKLFLARKYRRVSFLTNPLMIIERIKITI